jgi:hypothetical protein
MWAPKDKRHAQHALKNSSRTRGRGGRRQRLSIREKLLVKVEGMILATGGFGK